MTRTAKTTGRFLCSQLAGLVVLILLLGIALPQQAEAAVTSAKAWAGVTGGTGTTLATLPATSYTVGTGTNRLLVVALTVEYTGSATLINPVVTYGSKTLIPLANSSTKNGATRGRSFVWLGYLKEADIAAVGASGNLTASWTNSSGVVSNANLFASTYAGVNQTRPIPESYATTVNADTAATTTALAFGTDVKHAANGMVFYVGMDSGTSTTTTQATGFTASLAPVNYGSRGSIITAANKTTTTTAATVLGTVTLTMGSTTAAYTTVAVGVLNPDTVTYEPGYTKIPSSQSIVSGNLVALTQMIGGALPTGADQLGYDTDQTGMVYRAGSSKSDGFSSSTVNAKWIKTNIGGFTSAVPANVDGALNLPGIGSITNTGTTESFTYLYQSGSTGSFTMDVRVDSLLNTGTAAKAGLMVRASTANNSQFAAVYVTSGSGVIFQTRATAGAAAVATTVAGQTTPKWLRLVRNANSFSGYYSTDGNTWTQAGTTTTVSMTDPLTAGLVVAAGSTTIQSMGRFDNFIYMPASTSGMTTTWAGVGNITTNDGGALADWVSGTYGVSIRNGATGAVVDTNLFNLTVCTDATPSSINIPGSQTVKGSAVSFGTLYTTAGNLGAATYKINGVASVSPWNSLAVVPGGTSQTVTFEVRATDPDCGGKLVTSSNTLTVDNTCVDATTSTITIPTGQSTGGMVDLTRLFNKSGNVSGFSYKVNGVTVSFPWNSMAYGLSSPEMVTLQVIGTDPDCGGSTVIATNQIEIENICVRNPPSISFDDDKRYVGKGRAIPIAVTIRNEDAASCGVSTFNVAVLSESNLIDFNTSTITGGTGLILDGRQEATFQLTSSAKPAAVDWNYSDITLQITSSYGAHNTPKTTGTVRSVIYLVSPITHNSVTTHSTKWGGKWGTSEAGSKYSNFDCMICHDKSGPGVKWLKDSVTLPEGTVWGVGGSVNRVVEFTDGNAGSNDWGNDDPSGLDVQPDSKVGAGRTGSKRICEVCHAITQHHRYDTELDPDGGGSLTKQSAYNHFNDRDCTDCHRHSLGFTAGCTGCHGDPPLDSTLGGPNGLADIPAPTGSTTQGTHYKHTVVLGYPCEYCHSGWRAVGEMPRTVSTAGGDKQQINHKFNVFYDLGITDITKDNGHYTGQDGVNYEPNAVAIAAGLQLPDGTIPAGKGTMQCENIYCHGGSIGATFHPAWNGNLTCNACHGTTAGSPPPGYSHNTHVAQKGIPCSSCHGTSPVPGSNGHVNGRVKWDVSSLPGRGGTPMYKGAASGESNALGNDMPPSSSYGSCTNIACHYGRTTPVWNNNNQPSTCTTCHYDGTDNGLLVNSSPNTGNHAQHVHPLPASVDEKMVNGFINKCESCHGGGANTGTHTGHMDYTATISNMTYDGGAATCTSNCHNLKGIDGSNNPVAITWGSVNTLSCEACHEAPYIGPTVVDIDGVGGSGNGMAATGYGSHLKQLLGDSFTLSTQWGAQCKKCHPYHSGGVEVPEIPTNSTFGSGLGLAFPVTGGIHLGGSATTGTSEAEICWNCHDNASNKITRTASMTIVSAANNSSFVDAGNGLGNFKVGRYVKVSGATLQANNGYYKVKTVNAGSLFVEATLTAQATGTSITLVDDISEWSSNAPLSTSPIAAQSQYDYGALYTDTTTSPGTRTSNWTTGLWRSGRGLASTDMFWYKRGRIQSTHSANFTSGTSAVAGSIYGKTEIRDTVGDIRCSYCHDVHDMNRAIDIGTATAETYTGRPYLRGSWNSNPYEEDGAPQVSTIYYNTQRFGPVPRGNGVNQTSLGGFYIDINNVKPGTAQKPAGLAVAANGTTAANPTSGWTNNSSAGLCMACHNTDKLGNDVTVDTMDYETGEGLWLGTNGHANAVIGGTSLAAANIFEYRGSTTACSDVPRMHFAGCGAPGDSSWGFRNGGTSQYNYTPSLNPNNTENNENTTSPLNNWGTITYDDTTVNASYHKFSCSKCHNPHASRLPKLLITNCLDAKHNTWDDTYQLNARTGLNLNASLSNWSSAQNCHRLSGIADGTGPEAVDTGAVAPAKGTATDYANRGWNVVTPWTTGPPQ